MMTQSNAFVKLCQTTIFTGLIDSFFLISLKPEDLLVYLTVFIHKKLLHQGILKCK